LYIFVIVKSGFDSVFSVLTNRLGRMPSTTTCFVSVELTQSVSLCVLCLCENQRI